MSEEHGFPTPNLFSKEHKGSFYILLTYGHIQECELGSWEECGFLMKLLIHSGFGTTWLILELKHSGASIEARRELCISKEGLASFKGNYFCQ